MKTDSWAVVEQAGYANERVIAEWDNYDDAWCAMQELYTPEEREELHVDIMRWDEEQSAWTTEY